MSAAVVPYVVVALLHLGSKLLDAAAIDVATRPLLMPALALPVLLRLHTARTRSTVLLLVGLLFSWLGDLTLSWFIVGLGCFLVAHVAYVGVLWPLRGPRHVVPIVLAVLWWAGLLATLATSLGALVGPVAVYGAVLGTMAVMAARVSPVAAVGGVCFVASDSLLAVRLFTEHLRGVEADVVVMGLYCVAQLLIVVGVLAATPPGKG